MLPKNSSPYRIAYVHEGPGTSLYRAAALERLGHDVTLLRSRAVSELSGWRSRLHYETGGVLLAPRVARQLVRELEANPYDVLWVDHGRYVPPSLLEYARSKGIKSVVYNHDDPFGWRDRLSWTLYKSSIRHYDLTVVVRDENIAEAKTLGAKDVMRVWRSADEVAHAKRDFPEAMAGPYRSDICFVGTWMPGRDDFILGLVERGLNPVVIGDRWAKTSRWEEIKPYWKAGHTKTEDEYALWIQSAKVCIGLLSKANRDRCTTRSFEVPAMASVLCAERTDEHMKLYADGVEALFWDDIEECAQKCHQVLGQPGLRDSVALAGHQRVYANETMNEPVMQSILDRLMG